MSYQMILSEVRGRVGLITMNRPDRLNAMNPQMDYEIRQQIAEWNADDSIGAIVWTGAGQRVLRRRRHRTLRGETRWTGYRRRRARPARHLARDGQGR